MATAYEKKFPNYEDYIKDQLASGKPKTDDKFLAYHTEYIKQFTSLVPIPKTATILDLGCNTGQGMRVWNKLGYPNVHGIDLNQDNILKCRAAGLVNTFCVDAQHMYDMASGFFDLVYAIHSLEHMYSPSRVLAICCRILKKYGYLLAVLPYPCGDSSGHLGGVELGICQAVGSANATPYDDGASVCSFFKQQGFKVLDKKYDSVREPEIWLTLQKADRAL